MLRTRLYLIYAILFACANSPADKPRHSAGEEVFGRRAAVSSCSKNLVLNFELSKNSSLSAHEVGLGMAIVTLCALADPKLKDTLPKKISHYLEEGALEDRAYTLQGGERQPRVYDDSLHEYIETLREWSNVNQSVTTRFAPHPSLALIVAEQAQELKNSRNAGRAPRTQPAVLKLASELHEKIRSNPAFQAAQLPAETKAFWELLFREPPLADHLFGSKIASHLREVVTHGEKREPATAHKDLYTDYAFSEFPSKKAQDPLKEFLETPNPYTRFHGPTPTGFTAALGKLAPHEKETWLKWIDGNLASLAASGRSQETSAFARERLFRLKHAIEAGKKNAGPPLDFFQSQRSRFFLDRFLSDPKNAAIAKELADFSKEPLPTHVAWRFVNLHPAYRDYLKQIPKREIPDNLNHAEIIMAGLNHPDARRPLLQAIAADLVQRGGINPNDFKELTGIALDDLIKALGNSPARRWEYLAELRKVVGTKEKKLRDFFMDQTMTSRFLGEVMARTTTTPREKTVAFLNKVKAFFQQGNEKNLKPEELEAKIALLAAQSGVTGTKDLAKYVASAGELTASLSNKPTESPYWSSDPKAFAAYTTLLQILDEAGHGEDALQALHGGQDRYHPDYIYQQSILLEKVVTHQALEELKETLPKGQDPRAHLEKKIDELRSKIMKEAWDDPKKSAQDRYWGLPSLTRQQLIDLASPENELYVRMLEKVHKHAHEQSENHMDPSHTGSGPDNLYAQLRADPSPQVIEGALAALLPNEHARYVQYEQPKELRRFLLDDLSKNKGAFSPQGAHLLSLLAGIDLNRQEGSHSSLISPEEIRANFMERKVVDGRPTYVEKPELTARMASLGAALRDEAAEELLKAKPAKEKEADAILLEKLIQSGEAHKMYSDSKGKVDVSKIYTPRAVEERKKLQEKLAIAKRLEPHLGKIDLKLQPSITISPSEIAGRRDLEKELRDFFDTQKIRLNDQAGDNEMLRNANLRQTLPRNGTTVPQVLAVRKNAMAHDQAILRTQGNLVAMSLKRSEVFSSEEQLPRSLSGLQKRAAELRNTLSTKENAELARRILTIVIFYTPDVRKEETTKLLATLGGALADRAAGCIFSKPGAFRNASCQSFLEAMAHYWPYMAGEKASDLLEALKKDGEKKVADEKTKLARTYLAALLEGAAQIDPVEEDVLLKKITHFVEKIDQSTIDERERDGQRYALADTLIASHFVEDLKKISEEGKRHQAHEDLASNIKGILDERGEELGEATARRQALSERSAKDPRRLSVIRKLMSIGAYYDGLGLRFRENMGIHHLYDKHSIHLKPHGWTEANGLTDEQFREKRFKELKSTMDEADELGIPIQIELVSHAAPAAGGSFADLMNQLTTARYGSGFGNSNDWVPINKYLGTRPVHDRNQSFIAMDFDSAFSLERSAKTAAHATDTAARNLKTTIDDYESLFGGSSGEDLRKAGNRYAQAIDLLRRYGGIPIDDEGFTAKEKRAVELHRARQIFLREAQAIEKVMQDIEIMNKIGWTVIITIGTAGVGAYLLPLAEAALALNAGRAVAYAGRLYAFEKWTVNAVKSHPLLLRGAQSFVNTSLRAKHAVRQGMLGTAFSEGAVAAAYGYENLQLKWMMDQALEDRKHGRFNPRDSKYMEKFGRYANLMDENEDGYPDWHPNDATPGKNRVLPSLAESWDTGSKGFLFFAGMTMAAPLRVPAVPKAFTRFEGTVGRPMLHVTAGSATSDLPAYVRGEKTMGQVAHDAGMAGLLVGPTVWLGASGKPYQWLPNSPKLARIAHTVGLTAVSEGINYAVHGAPESPGAWAAQVGSSTYFHTLMTKAGERSALKEKIKAQGTDFAGLRKTWGNDKVEMALQEIRMTPKEIPESPELLNELAKRSGNQGLRTDIYTGVLRIQKSGITVEEVRNHTPMASRLAGPTSAPRSPFARTIEALRAKFNEPLKREDFLIHERDGNRRIVRDAKGKPVMVRERKSDPVYEMWEAMVSRGYEIADNPNQKLNILNGVLGDPLLAGSFRPRMNDVTPVQYDEAMRLYANTQQVMASRRKDFVNQDLSKAFSAYVLKQSKLNGPNFVTVEFLWNSFARPYSEGKNALSEADWRSYEKTYGYEQPPRQRSTNVPLLGRKP